MVIYTKVIGLVRGEIMRLSMNVALIALGAGVVLAYQRYHRPIMDKLGETTDKACKSINKALDNMM